MFRLGCQLKDGPAHCTHKESCKKKAIRVSKTERPPHFPQVLMFLQIHTPHIEIWLKAWRMGTTRKT